MPHDKLLFLSLLGSLLTPTARFVQPSPSQRLVALLPLSIEDRQTSLAGWCSSREPGRGASLDGGWHRRCCATGATDSANPANPGNLGHCAANQPRLPNPLARHRRTGRGGGAARGDGGIPKAASQGLHPHRTTAWHVLPAYPRRCHYEGDRRTRRETLQSARCAPASRQDVQNVQKTFSKL